ncbi:hypothetical protein [Pseudomonas sp. ZL2]
MATSIALLISRLALSPRPASEICRDPLLATVFGNLRIVLSDRDPGPPDNCSWRFTLHAWVSCQPSGLLRPVHRCLRCWPVVIRHLYNVSYGSNNNLSFHCVNNLGYFFAQKKARSAAGFG